jgi:hypothetical protein
MSDDFQLSDEERARLERLKRDLAPPAHLEASVIEALRRDGYIRFPRSRNRWVIAATLVTSIAAGLIAALLVHRTMDRSAPAHQPEFVLLLYAGTEADSGPSRRDEYTEWARSIGRQGITISGLELVEPSELIAVFPDDRQEPAPPQPRGFFVVRARDLAEAKRIAASCPHVKYGGQVVLRRAVS